MATVAGIGSKRGVVVLMHGMSTKIVPQPQDLPDLGGLLPAKLLTFANSLAADGWETIYPTFAEDWAAGNPALAIQADIVADAAHGARYLAQTLRWWDHIVDYVHRRYGPWPIVPFGGSWGGWHALQIAAGRQSTIIAYGADKPAVVLSAINPLFTDPADFSAVNTTGADLSATCVDNVLKPGIIGWGTGDTAVGFSTQQAIYNSALAAGRSVTSNATAEQHSFTSGNASTYASWFSSVVDPLAPAVF